MIGYVGKIQTCRQLADQLTRLKLKRILVDPVMGDRGEMYAGFGEDYLEAIKQLVKLATVITPNMTELAFKRNQIDGTINRRPADRRNSGL